MARCECPPLVALLVAASCSAPPLTPGASGASDPRAEAAWPGLAAELDALVEECAEPDSPGIALGVVRDGELVASSYRGLANLEHRVPVGPSTRFHVASVSKQFTGFAVHLLIERGELTLGDRVGDHLPDMPDCVAAITVDQLLHHTSGLRQTLRLQAVAGRRHGRVLTQAEALGLIRAHRELNFEPGAEFTYSNANFIVLASIVEAVTAEPFPDWMRSNVFEPVGMGRTIVVDSYAQVVPDRARSYGQEGDGFEHDSGLFWAIYGGTGVHATLGDLARWVSFLMDPPERYAGVVASMQEVGTLADGTPLRYGSGLMLDEYRRQRRVGHGGEGDGVHTYVMWFPDLGVGAILLENAELVRSMSGATRAADLALDRIDGVPAPALAELVPEEDAAPLPIPEELRMRAAGRFLIVDSSAHSVPEIVRIAREADGLVLIPPSGERVPLVSVGRDGLAGAGTPVRFEVPEGNGPAASLTFRLPDRTLPMRRIEETASTPPPAAGLVGRYFSPEIDTHFDVVGSKEGVFLRHTVHGEIALEHVHGDAFDTGRGAIRWITFQRGEGGEVIGFRLTNSNRRVSGLWFERSNPASSPGPAAQR